MKYTKYNNPEKLFERFERVNKIKIDESVIDTLSLDSKLIEYYNLLKQNQLKVDSINTSVSGDESFVELVCTDDAGNEIRFNFKSRFDEGNDDGIFNLVDGEMIAFGFNSNDSTTNIEIDENGLKSFNERFANEIVDIISDYVDVESNQPDEALYNEAVKKIDDRTFMPLSLHENINSSIDGATLSFENLPYEDKKYYINMARENFIQYLKAMEVEPWSIPQDELKQAIIKIAREYFIAKLQKMNEDYPDPIAKSFTSKKSNPFKEKRRSKKTMIINELNTDTVPGYSNVDLPQDNMEDGDIDNYEPMNVSEFNQIKGGLADGQDISNFDKEQLLRGIGVELEHTNDPKIAVEIAMDHLMEDPEYYGVADDDPEAMAQQHASVEADDNLENKLLGFQQIRESGGEHCVVWDGTSAYICPSSDVEEEEVAGNEILKQFNDIDAAQNYADKINADAYRYER